VLDEFLEKIADPNVVKLVRYRGAKFFDPPARSFFIPLEFAVAAYRFGHSKVRPAYNYFNEGRDEAGLAQLFRTNRRLSGDWVIEWPSFLDAENRDRFPRPIDTSLTGQLLSLPKMGEVASETNLAIRNLLRGYLLRLPTGQAVAKAMASQGMLPMTEDQIASVAKEISSKQDEAKISPKQFDVLVKTEFLTKTPLWFYILAEALFTIAGIISGQLEAPLLPRF